MQKNKMEGGRSSSTAQNTISQMAAAMLTNIKKKTIIVHMPNGESREVRQDMIDFVRKYQTGTVFGLLGNFFDELSAAVEYIKQQGDTHVNKLDE